MTMFHVVTVFLKVVFWMAIHVFFFYVELILWKRPFDMPRPVVITLVSILWGITAYLTFREARVGWRWALQPPEDPAKTSHDLIELERTTRQKEMKQIIEGGA